METAKNAMGSAAETVKSMANSASDAMSNVAEAAKEKLSGLKVESNEVRPEDITNIDSQLANEPAYQAGMNQNLNIR
uniref:Late embryogenesis abundant protein n=1 Tax=Panagrolaimus sp. ES5 TaxID=591445 RepID=A0AC34FU28_9BILA